MIRIGIVDDHAIVRTGLRQYLSDHVDLRVTGEGASGHDALEMARGGEVDVLLLDISMPDQSGGGCTCGDQGAFPRAAGAHPERLPRGALRHDAAAPGRERLT